MATVMSPLVASKKSPGPLRVVQLLMGGFLRFCLASRIR